MKIDFDKSGGLVPAVIQDAVSGAVLMVGYMNEAALRETQTTGLVTFYSRSKERLWTKGETSGHHLRMCSITPDCDGDTLLIQALPQGPACHLGNATCFGPANSKGFLYVVEAIVHDRRDRADNNSYTRRLLNDGTKRIAQKLGEEATELVLEAVDGDRSAFLGEAADLLYHLLVLLADRSLSIADVEEVLQQRHLEK